MSTDPGRIQQGVKTEHVSTVILNLMKEYYEDEYTLSHKVGCSFRMIQDLLRKKIRLEAWLAVSIAKYLRVAPRMLLSQQMEYELESLEQEPKTRTRVIWQQELIEQSPLQNPP